MCSPSHSVVNFYPSLAYCALSLFHMWWEYMENARARNNFAKRVLFRPRGETFASVSISIWDRRLESAAPTLVLFKNNTLARWIFHQTKLPLARAPKSIFYSLLSWAHRALFVLAPCVFGFPKHLRRYYICQWACTWLGSHTLLIRWT